MLGVTKKDSDQPDALGVAQRQEADALNFVRDVYAGTRALRAKGATYLPRFPLETDKGYEARRTTAVLFNAFRRTIKALVGMVFRKPVVLLEDVPAIIRGEEADEDTGRPRIVGHAENIDLAGRDLNTFARDHFEDAKRDGHADIFVDWEPVDPAEVLTLGDERDRGLRPYWIHVPKSDVVRHRARKIAGRMVLTAYAYRQVSTEDHGKFGEKEVERIRDYRLATVNTEAGDRLRVRFDVYRKKDKGGEGQDQWENEKGGWLTIDEIPVSTTYTNRTGFRRSDPPLEDLAFENVRHFQIRSDRDNTLHIAGVPIPVFMGLETQGPGGRKVETGSDRGIRLPLGGDAKYLEPEGVALTSTQQELKDIEHRMALLGLSMLVSESRAAETATSKRIDKSESDSQLTSSAQGLQRGLQEALRLHAKWLTPEDQRTPNITGGTVQVNMDFVDEPMDPQTAEFLANLVRTNLLSLETFLQALEAGELLVDGFDLEREIERLGGLDALRAFVPSREEEPGGADPASDDPEDDDEPMKEAA